MAQHKFIVDGKHLKTFSQRYAPVFEKEMIQEPKRKRLNLKEKFAAELALHLQKLPELVRGYLGKFTLRKCYQVCNFYGETHYEALAEGGGVE